MAVSKTESLSESIDEVSPTARVARLPSSQLVTRPIRVPTIIETSVHFRSYGTPRPANPPSCDSAAVTEAIEAIEKLAMRTNSFAVATERELQAMPWTDADDDGERGLIRERLQHLFGATGDAAFATVQAVRQAMTQVEKLLARIPGSR